LPAGIHGFELGQVLDEHPELRAVAAQQCDAIRQAIHAPELAELIQKKPDPMRGPVRDGHDTVEGKTDEAPYEPEADAQPVRRNGEKR
jgi:hypothetical protein